MGYVRKIWKTTTNLLVQHFLQWNLYLCFKKKSKFESFEITSTISRVIKFINRCIKKEGKWTKLSFCGPCALLKLSTLSVFSMFVLKAASFKRVTVFWSLCKLIEFLLPSLVVWGTNHRGWRRWWRRRWRWERWRRRWR